MNDSTEVLFNAFGVQDAKIHFFNPFTGKTEEFLGERDANGKMLAAAAARINALEEEIERIKTFLVI